MARPVLFVLAGVNGAGKSSIGGHLLTRHGLSWFDPDNFARELVAQTGCGQATANAVAWAEGVRRLDAAVSAPRSYAFETTLGGGTITRRLLAASRTHDVIVWFWGLASPEQHLARVRQRAALGGHDIPEGAIRERWPRARQNLIRLMPHLAHLQVFDNSADVAVGHPVPDPVLVLELAKGRLVRPAGHSLLSLRRIPDWAKPLVEAALSAG
jgi:predicted ABC-type ATPase